MSDAVTAPEERPTRTTRARGSIRYIRRKIIVGGQDHGAGGTDRLRQGALFCGDRFARAHVFDVSDADVGNDRDVGSRKPGQRRDLPRMVHADLPDGGVVGDGCGKNRKGKADVIVEVALGLDHAVARGKNCGGELLCAGFSAASRHAGDLEGKTVAPRGGQSMQRGKGVIHEDDRESRGKISGRGVKDGAALRLVAAAVFA